MLGRRWLRNVPMVLILVGLAGGTSAATFGGVVFEDLDGSGFRDAGEPGLEGVRISNGHEIVLSDAEGRYELPVGDDAAIFVIKPSGWATPVDRNGLPRFYHLHKPAGSPNLDYPGVAPTGALPKSVDFPMRRQDEPEAFRMVLFGDTQTSNQYEINFLAHDLVEELVGVDAAFGVTLGDIMNDDLGLYDSQNEVVGRIGIPWYHVIGNHDQNYDAPSDALADETFERIYGPAYYSFDYARVHFVVLDDAYWRGPVEDKKRWKGGNYVGGLSERQLAWLRNDLALVESDRRVVLMMHIPFSATWIEEEREAVYRLVANRPLTNSFAAHYHTTQHLFLEEREGWPGLMEHHHFVAPTACGSWWSGSPDESGIPHSTMSDGCPNGYCFVDFDGEDYAISFKAARRPADHQMSIVAPEAVAADRAAEAEVLVNVFIASSRQRVEFRLGDAGPWLLMERVKREDPLYLWQKELEKKRSTPRELQLPKPTKSTHIWQAKLPPDPPRGTQLIQVRSTDLFGRVSTGSRIIRVN